MKFREKKKIDESDYERLERLLMTIGYHESTWPNRKELTKDEFLELTYNRFKNTLHASVQEIMKTAFYGKQLEVKSLDEWLDDDGFDDRVMLNFKESLQRMIDHYTNLMSTVEMRQFIKHQDPAKEYVYFICDVPPELKGIGELIYVYLDKESYDFINESLSKEDDYVDYYR